MIDEQSVIWNRHLEETDEDTNERPSKETSLSRRTLLFHIAALIDINECHLDFLDATAEEKGKYYSRLYRAATSEINALKDENELR